MADNLTINVNENFDMDLFAHSYKIIFSRKDFL